MHKLESVLENKTHKILWDFEIQIYFLIPSRRLDLVSIYKEKKRTFRLMDFVVPTDHGVKIKERKKSDKCVDLSENSESWGRWG